MNKETFAQLLNGREYRNEITDEEHKLAKQNNLLVCFGASDDLLELRGIIYDEVGAWDGCTCFIVKKKGGEVGVLSDNALEEITQIMSDNKLDFTIPRVVVEAVWCPKELDCSWEISAHVPFSSFDILEDGELYCRGCVIEKQDILNYLNP